MNGFLSTGEWRTAGSSFTYNAHDIFYRDEGAGDVLICIHGYPTASWDWHRIWPALTDRFRVIAADMIGFGFSAKPADYTYSIHDQATLHETLLQHLNVNCVHILAHDYGDTVAQELLARHTERRRHSMGTDYCEYDIRSVCLLNGGIFPDIIRPRLIQKALVSPFGRLVALLINEPLFRRSFAAVFGETTHPSEDELRAFWSLITHNDGLAVAHKISQYQNERIQFHDRWTSSLQHTTVPLRFIVGPADPVSGAHMAERYRDVVPHPDVVTLNQDIGHYPQIEAPRDVLRNLFAFIERIP